MLKKVGHSAVKEFQQTCSWTRGQKWHVNVGLFPSKALISFGFSISVFTRNAIEPHATSNWSVSRTFISIWDHISVRKNS